VRSEGGRAHSCKGDTRDQWANAKKILVGNQGKIIMGGWVLGQKKKKRAVKRIAAVQSRKQRGENLSWPVRIEPIWPRKKMGNKKNFLQAGFYQGGREGKRKRFRDEESQMVQQCVWEIKRLWKKSNRSRGNNRQHGTKKTSRINH